MSVEELRKALAQQGLVLQDADVAATLATAQFLMQAARMVREAAK